MFVTQLFLASAVLGSVLLLRAEGIPVRADAMLLLQTLNHQVMGSFGTRMAAVFTLSVTSLATRSGALPRWLTVLGIVSAVVLFAGPLLTRWSQLVFPTWVLIFSIHLLVVRSRETLSAQLTRRRATRIPSVRRRVPAAAPEVLLDQIAQRERLRIVCDGVEPGVQIAERRAGDDRGLHHAGGLRDLGQDRVAEGSHGTGLAVGRQQDRQPHGRRRRRAQDLHSGQREAAGQRLAADGRIDLEREVDDDVLDDPGGHASMVTPRPP